ncbi:ABC transporter permease [Rhizobium binxianense]
MQSPDGVQHTYLMRTHLRVVCALLVREMATRFGRRPGGYIWTLLDPAAHIALLTLIFQAIAHVPALGTSFPLFFATGYVGFQFYSAVVTYLNGAVRANKALLSYPNVAPIDTIFARYALQLGTTCAVAILVLGTISFTLRIPLTLDWPVIFEAGLLASVIGLGIGLFNNVMFARYPIYEQIFGIVSRPLFMVTGIFFLPDSIPLPYRDYLLLNPLCHAVMRFRSGFYAEYGPEVLNMNYLYIFSFLTLFTGMLVFTSSKSILRNE